MKSLFFSIAAIAMVCATAKADLPKVCYTTVDNGQFCTTDNLGKVQVFVYNAGWCPSCNDEMDQLPAVYDRFSAQGVVFASLSGEGYESGSQPDQAFLTDWKQKHHIDFIVAGTFGDFGTAFNAPGYIPYAVIVSQSGAVTKTGALGPDEIAQEVQRLLGTNP